MIRHDHNFAQRALWALVLAILVALLAFTVASPASASETAPTPSLGFDFFDFSTSANVVLMLGFVIPIITGVITKKVAHPGVKAVSTMILSALAASVAVLVADDGGWAWRAFGNAFLSVFVPAIVTYYGFWKPTGVAGMVQTATENVGVLVKAKSDVPVVTPAPAPTETTSKGEVVAEVSPDGSLTVEPVTDTGWDPEQANDRPL